MSKKNKIFRIGIFICMLFLFDFILGHLIQRLFFLQKETANARLIYSLYSANEDIMIYGNSRALCHYNPKIIEDSLHLSCYNACRDGGYSILIQAAQISSLLEYHLPKVVICEYDFTYMDYRSIDYQRLNILLPFANRNQYIAELIGLRSPFEKFKLMSKLYPFNSDVINIIRYNINPKKSHITEFGYDPVNRPNIGVKNDINYPYSADTYLDVNKFHAIEMIINLCKEKNIILIFINSPIYRPDELFKPNLSFAAEKTIKLLIRNKVPFLDMSNDTILTKHIDFFYDIGHLNEKGSNLFSKRISSQLKKILISRTDNSLDTLQN